MKKIISTALVVIMLLTTVVAIIPVTAFAALSAAPESQEDDNYLTFTEVQAYIDGDNYVSAKYKTAQDMLEAELNYTDKNGMPVKLLDSATSADGKYTVYVNRYTGFLYYVNNITGQIITSNPIDPGYKDQLTEEERQRLMSQIEIKFLESTNLNATPSDYNSTQWAARYSQISVSKIAGGLRVNYTLGDTSTRFLLPGRITAKNFHDFIIKPMLTTFEDLFLEAMTSVELADSAYDIIGENVRPNENPYYRYNHGELAGTTDEYILNNKRVEDYMEDAISLCKSNEVSKEYTEVMSSIKGALVQLYTNYTVQNTQHNDYYKGANGELTNPKAIEDMLKKYPICETTPIYVFNEDVFKDNQIASFRRFSAYIENYCPEYTFELMYAHEKECGFEYTAAQKPIFRCSLEYTFNSDGTLSVRLPANSIVFDETEYTLVSITPLRFLGYGDMSRDGYFFYPDGSGSILEFSEFYTDSNKPNLNLESKIYGKDYCYSNITGKHREQINMPVYGIVTEANANKKTEELFGLTTVDNGCFVILEEGASLASVGFQSGGDSHKYVAVYAAYNPYPSDKYDLSASLSVGGSGESHTMVAEEKYSGSYVSRVVMLTDTSIGEAYYGSGNYYDTTYVGMASYYRDILKANGTLRALEKVEKDIPLYIEALGAMTVKDKFLTFPVEKSIPLTTFENVATMYQELSQAELHVKSLYEKYRDLAKEEENDLLRIEYENKADKYKGLIDKVENIKNVNFRLTGFANGGMNYTYPTKLKWEKCCGGKSGFEDLISISESQEAGYKFGIYPDFDFLYINNGGLKKKGNASRMIDNRYASKQVYNSILGEFESFFALVISTDTLSKHFETFNEKYSEFNHSKISVATVGSDLNSNFNEKNTVTREDSVRNTVALLEEMVYQNDYEVMMDSGNIYAAKYATHILNASIDFSNFTFSSYAVPFVGMVLHGYVNYAGAPLNYSGSPDYDILRAIENGANPYYILCYQNTSHMKDDQALSKYYGVDYENWYDEILTTYATLNSVLAGLQDYEIVDHKTVLVERTSDAKERLSDYNTLKAFLLADLRAQLTGEVDKAVNEHGLALKVSVNVELLYKQFTEKLLKEYASEIKADVANGENAIKAAIVEIALEFANKYPGSSSGDFVLEFTALKNESGVAYESYRDYDKYSFTTYSTVWDNDEVYDATNYTLDNGNVVMVTYRKGNDEKHFVLNYNLFEVDVRIDENTVITIGSYEYEPVKRPANK